MKLLFARLVCLNAVILLTSGILFGAIDLKSSVSTTTNKKHFSAKSDLNIGSFSFFEEEEEDDEQSIKINYLLDYNQSVFLNTKRDLKNHRNNSSNYLLHVIHKTPIWIKIRHIII